MATKQAPEYLSPDARKWYRQAQRDYVFSDSELQLLGEAASTLDRLAECRRAIASHGLFAETGAGGVKLHPAGALERDLRVVLARLMRELRLLDSTPAETRLPRRS